MFEKYEFAAQKEKERTKAQKKYLKDDFLGFLLSFEFSTSLYPYVLLSNLEKMMPLWFDFTYVSLLYEWRCMRRV